MPGKAAVWWPSCKVRMFIRFEDFLTKNIAPPLPPNPAEGAEAFADNPGFVQIHDIVPFNLSYELNSYRQADTCKLTIPLRALPLDPRIIRAVAISVFGGTIDALAYAEAVGPTGGARQVVADYDVDGKPNEFFRGVADDWEQNLEGADTLTVAARDATSVLIDANITENVQNFFNPDLPLDIAIQTFLQGDGLPPSTSKIPGLPGLRGVRVVNETGAPLPTLRLIKAPHDFDSTKRLKKAKPGRTNSKSKISYWDLITDLCVSAGFICFVRLAAVPPAQGLLGIPLLPSTRAVEIVVSNPRTFYGSVEPPRQFFYGGNVNKLRIRRNLTGLVTPTIEVRAFSTRIGETIKAKFPADKPDNVSFPSSRGDREEVRVFVLKIDPALPIAAAQLFLAAQSIYEQLGRNEMEVNIKTWALSILGFNSEDPNLRPDLFQLKPGDPIFVAVAVGNVEAGRVAEAVTFSTASAPEKQKNMIRDGFLPATPEGIALAGKIATTLDSPNFTRLFRVKTVVVQWQYDQGFEFEVNAINFIDIRNALLSTADTAAKLAAEAASEAAAVAALQKQLAEQGIFL